MQRELAFGQTMPLESAECAKRRSAEPSYLEPRFSTRHAYPPAHAVNCSGSAQRCLSRSSDCGAFRTLRCAADAQRASVRRINCSEACVVAC